MSREDEQAQIFKRIMILKNLKIQKCIVTTMLKVVNDPLRRNDELIKWRRGNSTEAKRRILTGGTKFTWRLHKYPKIVCKCWEKWEQNTMQPEEYTEPSWSMKER